jgi:hypothetical protein
MVEESGGHRLGGGKRLASGLKTTRISAFSYGNQTLLLSGDAKNQGDA